MLEMKYPVGIHTMGFWPISSAAQIDNTQGFLHYFFLSKTKNGYISKENSNKNLYSSEMKVSQYSDEEYFQKCNNLHHYTCPLEN